MLAHDKHSFLMSEKGTPLKAFAREHLCNLIDALQSLHGLGYVHRDVRPDNILRIQFSTQVLLIDFGYAARADAMVTYSGTLHYASEEVLTHLHEQPHAAFKFHPRNDLISLVQSAFALQQPYARSHLMDIKTKAPGIPFNRAAALKIVSFWNQQFSEMHVWQPCLEAAKACDYDGLKYALSALFSSITWPSS